MSRTWKPNVTVAAVVERAGRFLMVEEHTPEGLRLNQPAGHLEADESLLQAVVRETVEETAYAFTPECVVGVYLWPRPRGDVTYLRLAFGGTVGDTPADTALDAGIVRAVWMAPDELRACASRHRSPLVMQCVDDWIAGRRFGLDLIRCYV
ncbi:MAG: NUDIX hydrolase [Rhodocyclales bacterium]|nr:NUDIX hydrolase [Rhodocyclales bacterium]